MQNFIVLGYVPGTRIQITFRIWLFVVAGIVACYLAISYRHEEIPVGDYYERFLSAFQHWLSEPVIE